MADPPAEPADSRAPGHAAYCRDLLREGDRDRYLATLLAPRERQGALFALYAFNLEIARVRDVVSDPLPGEVRLQWWREAIAGEGRGDVAAHPVAAALLAAIMRYRLPRQAFADLIEARIFDLYDDPMPSLADLEGYCGATSSVLMRLASLILADGNDPGGADAPGHAGLAYAITGLLRAFPWNAARGQLFIPLDILNAHGVTRQDVLSRRDGPGLRAALARMRAIARDHLAQARPPIGEVHWPASAAFLPAAVIELYLTRMEQPDYDPFASVIDAPQWRRQWLLWRASRRESLV